MFWRNLQKFKENNVYTTQTYFSPNKFCDKIETKFVFYFILFHKKTKNLSFLNLENTNWSTVHSFLPLLSFTIQYG